MAQIDLSKLITSEMKAVAARSDASSRIEAAVERHVDQIAQARGYRNGSTLASYGSSTMPRWAAEAAIFVEWRDAVWRRAFVEMEAVKAGADEPKSVAAIVGEMPLIAWPD